MEILKTLLKVLVIATVYLGMASTAWLFSEGQGRSPTLYLGFPSVAFGATAHKLHPDALFDREISRTLQGVRI